MTCFKSLTPPKEPCPPGSSQLSWKTHQIQAGHIDSVGIHLQIPRPISLSDGNPQPSRLGNQVCHKKGVGFLVCVARSFSNGLEANLACLASQSLKNPTLMLSMVWKQVGWWSQAEKERHIGGWTTREHHPLGPCSCAPPSPASLDCPKETLTLYLSLVGLSFCPLAAGKGHNPHFHKQLNVGALQRGFLLSGLSFFRTVFRAAFNLGIKLTKVQNPLLCMENPLQSVVYLPSSQPPPCFVLIFGA